MNPRLWAPFYLAMNYECSLGLDSLLHAMCRSGLASRNRLFLFACRGEESTSCTQYA